MSVFVHAQGIKIVHAVVGECPKMAKFCPRSCRIAPKGPFISISSGQRNLMKTYHNEANTYRITNCIEKKLDCFVIPPVLASL